MTHYDKILNAKRLVIKTGSALVTDETHGTARRAWMQSLASDVAMLKAQGKEVVIVTSGAVALGRTVLGIQEKNLKLEQKQASAACGQNLLMLAWAEAFSAHGLHVAQLLLTVDDSEHRRRYLNARNTLEVLLAQNIIPIINENDTVATAEIRIGDNDRLAARAAQMVSADVLVLLSDIDGLYTANPKQDAAAAFIEEVKEVTPEIEGFAGKAESAFGTGGMATKLMAARIAMHAGCHMVIARGVEEHPLTRLARGERCTWFIAPVSPIRARKQWIAGAVHTNGKVVVDEGAQTALEHGNSLLPAGVTQVQGAFERGDTVLIVNGSGRLLGRGLSAYSAGDAQKIMGQKSSTIERILGFKGRDTLIHRDDMVLE